MFWVGLLSVMAFTAHIGFGAVTSGNMIRSRLWLTVAMAFLMACAPQRKEPPSLTAGRVTMAADASLRPLLDELIGVYQGRYPEAHIRAIYADPDSVAGLFLSDSAQLALLGAQLSDAQLQPVREQGVAVRQLLFAADGIAFIVNKKRNDTLYDVNQIVYLLQGKDQRGDTIVLVVPGMRSALYQALQKLVPEPATLTHRIFALPDEEGVLAYVEQNPQAVGVISSSWISNRGDSISENILRRVQVLAVRDSSGKACRPIRAHLFSRCYPFLREIYLVIREKGIGVGMGFGTFLMAQDGQLAVHRFGLLAVKQPVRMIEVRNNF